MSADATLPADDARKPAAKTGAFVQVAPDSEVPDTRPKESGGRGLLVGAAIAAAFWGAVAAAVVLLRSN